MIFQSHIYEEKREREREREREKGRVRGRERGREGEVEGERQGEEKGRGEKERGREAHLCDISLAYNKNERISPLYKPSDPYPYES